MPKNVIQNSITKGGIVNSGMNSGTLRISCVCWVRSFSFGNLQSTESVLPQISRYLIEDAQTAFMTDDGLLKMGRIRELLGRLRGS